jgi:hypothetical protein
MSKTQGRRNSARANNGRSVSDYEVGYCRPPKKTRFKTGQSGNPKGRPKGSKNEATILRNIFNRQIESREGSRVRKISVLEGMLLKFAEDALKGNPKSAAFLLNRLRLTEDVASETDEPNRDDRELIDSFLKRWVEAKPKTKRSDP